MVAFITENMAPIMFFSLIVILILGYPVAFALSAVGLGFAFIGIEFGMFGEAFLRALPDRVFGTMANETLLAIPFFTFMGLILQRSGMAEDLIDTIGQLFGPLRGGIAYAVIFVGALLAAITGVVAASVISMSLIALPIMLRYGYDRYLATGVIMASGTLAQTVPPSIILIVFILGFFLDFFEIAFILVPLLAPAAEALGIDLIWFAVMLAINLQASYLTPPFGFALFFMRSATPARAYTDTVTGKRIEGIKTADIYRAGVAFVVLQLVMIGILIAFPQLVTHYRGGGFDGNLDDIRIEIPAPDDDLGLPDLDLPDLDLD